MSQYVSMGSTKLVAMAFPENRAPSWSSGVVVQIWPAWVITLWQLSSIVAKAGTWAATSVQMPPSAGAGMARTTRSKSVPCARTCSTAPGARPPCSKATPSARSAGPPTNWSQRGSFGQQGRPATSTRGSYSVPCSSSAWRTSRIPSTCVRSVERLESGDLPEELEAHPTVPEHLVEGSEHGVPHAGLHLVGDVLPVGAHEAEDPVDACTGGQVGHGAAFSNR